jgi:ABC-2 type transport system permease protein
MKAFTITANALRRYFRDRMALFFTIAFPIVIILVVGSATAQFDDDTIPVGIVQESGGPFAVELERSLARDDTVELEPFDEREDLAKAVRRGVVAAGVVIPANYDERLRSGERAEVRLLVDQARGFPAATRSVVAAAAAEQGASIQAAHFATERGGRTFDANLADARRASDLLASTKVEVSSERVGRADDETSLAPGIGYQTPSMMLVFVFITSLAGAASLIQARRLGVIRRMYATPTHARTILGGEMLSRFSLGAFQAVFLFVVGTFLFGVEWGDPLGAVAVIVLFVLVGTSAGMLFGAVLRTPEQAASIGPPLGIGLGMLGGCMWPLEIVPEPMQAAGHLFPHAWAMDAWIELIGRGGGVGDIATELAVLAGFVAVLFPLGAWRLRRAILTG